MADRLTPVAELARYPTWAHVTHCPTDNGLEPMSAEGALISTKTYYADHLDEHPHDRITRPVTVKPTADQLDLDL